MSDAPDITITKCANCGKGEERSGDLKSCTACKLVKYCNRECQIAHRPLHKKACKKRAAELHDEALFKEHPPSEECPICFLTLPLDDESNIFQSCCGKVICKGCIYAMDEEARGRGGEVGLCAFCRGPNPSFVEEEVERLKKLLEANNAHAFYILGRCYDHGDGVPQDYEKASELYLRAGELGCADGYCKLGIFYYNGKGVEIDKKKAKYYYELAAMNGIVHARYNLGSMEVDVGNYHRAKQHYIIAAKAGFKLCLDKVRAGYMNGHVTKDEYASTLRAFQQRHDEMKSDTRDRARESDLY